MSKLAESLHHLELLDLVTLRQSEPNTVYAFKHVFTQESVYNSLLLSDRRNLHQQVGEALETIYLASTSNGNSADINEISLVLAYHFEHGQAQQKAIKYLKQAAAQAKKSYANREALSLYGRALDLLDDNDFVKQWDLLSEREQILGRLGERAEQLEHLATMHQLAEMTDDKHRLALTCLRLATYHDKTSQYQQAAEAAQTGLEVARRSNNQRLIAQSLNQLALAAWRRFEYQQVKAYANEALDATRIISDPQIRMGSLLHLGKASYRLGEYDSALDYIHAVLDLANMGDSPDSEANAHLILGWIYQRLGDYQAAAEHFTAKLEKRRITGDRYGQAMALSHLGWIAHDQHDYEAGIDFCQQALATSQAIDDLENEAYSLAGLGLNYERLGDLATATSYYQQALTIHRQIGATTLLIFDQAMLAQVALTQQDLATAQAYIQEVVAWILAGNAQKFWDPWSIYLAAYRVLLATDDTTTAHKILSEAHTCLQQRAAAISDEPLRHRFLTEVEANRDLQAAWEKV